MIVFFLVIFFDRKGFGKLFFVFRKEFSGFLRGRGRSGERFSVNGLS